jgi:hypothetical protein
MDTIWISNGKQALKAVIQTRVEFADNTSPEPIELHRLINPAAPGFLPTEAQHASD